MCRGGNACDFGIGVDDIQLIGERLSAILSESSEVVVVAEGSNGWDAIEKARKYQPDVVLLDISMPELTGLQAAPLIKQAAPRFTGLDCLCARKSLAYACRVCGRSAWL